MPKTLHVLRPFRLLLNDDEQQKAGAVGNTVEFGLGRHDDVPDVIADHPFTQLHLGSEQEVNDAVRPASAAGYRPSVPMVEQSVYDELLAHTDTLRARIASLEGGTQGQGSTIATLNEQLGEANRQRVEAEATLEAEKKAHAETRALLDEATAPKADASDDEQAEPPVGDVSIRHKGRGLFGVFRGEEQIGDVMPKADAEAKAAELRAQG